MIEAYLQSIWAQKRIPFNRLRLTDGREIIVHHPGVHNEQLSGPDFFLGGVTIDNIRLHGSIEIHVKSSDWIKHGHHKDPAYNNVILHVVYSHDQEIIQNGHMLPTLELKNLIDEAHFESYLMKRYRRKEFPCEKLLDAIDPIFMERMKHRALIQKLSVKLSILQEVGSFSDGALLYHLVSSAFGTQINKEGFIDLCERVPLSVLKSLNVSQRYRLLMLESGIYKLDESEMSAKSYWHYKGTRPANFPTIRVQQFAFFTAYFDFDTFLEKASTLELEIKQYFFSVIDELWSRHGAGVPKLSGTFKDLLLINAVVPFIWWKGNKLENEAIQETALSLLEGISGEKNSVIQKWSKIGINAKTAYDSQALLALHRYYCCRKKCLSCEVGNKLLNRSE